MNITRMLRELATNDNGVTMLEYALVAALIAVVCVVLVGAVGGNVTALYTQVCNEITTAISGAPTC